MKGSNDGSRGKGSGQGELGGIIKTREEEEISNCPKCGEDAMYSFGDGTVGCQACGYMDTVENYNKTEADLDELPDNPQDEHARSRRESAACH